MFENTRDALRAKTVGRAAHLVTKRIAYYPPIYKEDENGVYLDGHEEMPIYVEVRQPTVRQRNDLIKLCRRPDGSVDELEFIVQAALHFVYVPGTNEHVFEKQDHENLLDQPAGGFVDQFSAEAIKLLNMEDHAKNLKNSEETPTDKPSSP